MFRVRAIPRKPKVYIHKILDEPTPDLEVPESFRGDIDSLGIPILLEVGKAEVK